MQHLKTKEENMKKYNRTIDSYINQMNHTADTFEKKAKRLWAQAKNGGPAEGYKYARSRECFEKTKRYRASALEALKNK